LGAVISGKSFPVRYNFYNRHYTPNWGEKQHGVAYRMPFAENAGQRPVNQTTLAMPQKLAYIDGIDVSGEETERWKRRIKL
jgi:hypothetical protein